MPPVLRTGDELDRVLERVLTHALRMLGASHGYIHLADSPGGEELRMRVAAGHFARFRGTRLRPGEGVGGTVWKTGRALVVEDYDAWAGRRRDVEPGLLGSVMGAPLRSGGQTVGVISVARPEGGFGERELQVLVECAELAAVALENARLYAEAREELAARRRAEEALRRSEARLRAVVAGSPVTMFALDPSGVFTLAEGRGLERMGLLPEEVVGRSAFEVIGGDPRLAADLRRALAGECLASVAEFGEVVLELHLSPLLREGRVEGVIGVATDVTGRVAAERRLRESESELRAVFAAMTDAVLVLDREGRYLRVSSADPSLLYAPAEGRVGKTVHEVLPREQARLFMDAIRRALEGGRTIGVEYELPTGGRSRWFSARVSPMPGGRVVWVARDITERREAERRLRESEERFRVLADAALEGLVISERGRILEVNRAYTEILGYEPEEVVGAPVLGRVVPEHREIARRRIAAGYDRPYEVEAVRKDGRRVHLEIRGRQATYRGRRVRITAMRDVTERKRAERELREAQEQYRRLVEQLPAVVYIDRLDETSSNVYSSPQTEKIFGYSPQEWASDPEMFPRVLHPADRESVLAAHARANARGEPLELEYRLIARDGRVVWVRDSSIVLRDAEGNPRWRQGLMVDITEQKNLEARLVHLAFHDPLTGLPNRALFMDRLEHALARAGRSGDVLAVLFIDLDNFKFVNDSLGHEAGDRLLALVARRLSGATRPGDTVARLGGDEFTVLLEGIADGGEAARVAGRVAEVLREPFRVAGRELFVSASVGISVSTAGSGSVEELMRGADLAMYEAKREGKDRYRVFDFGMSRTAHDRLRLENDLRRAVGRDELRLYYQPVVRLGDGRVVAFEALLRWEHPRRGILLPDRFVPLAEETGMIVGIGRRVLELACSRAAGWRRQEPSLAVSVNISARQLVRPDFVEEVGRILQRTGLEPEGLVLEVTESAAMDEPGEAARALQRLRERGVRLALDDFGTGYSSLSYLRRLPVCFLKIDRSFVEGLGGDSGSGVLVGGVIALSRELGFEPVAEGIETPGQLERLLELGCELGQGYYFASPMPEGAAGELVRSGARLGAGSTLLAARRRGADRR
ncbi:diguanylate cyclase/phosphodiesterase with PAS/PAC and GAF sensor(s) [Rubrobacter xylanophilus DSM 9941]|uniref:Diguanylate cyclase/phosphodiesterase with PAS/PAC and GAF sensor(S) n=1 Tax=Rubrobacter xylanophilus (strain DSM 9941 / JCM 11954 / NBRC 16129 / PRD-1) TaxID=266117 RepID=Q1ASD1_RUBXD|nr:EAL domain-containing protein [Rubrobacter xylanophilus]ABG05697.1 diguanylate cyclase/phosphodiesterase with PAS/PAC and GAF sensor(s) [Rubrobacter xylanophilus DSM 9941]